MKSKRHPKAKAVPEKQAKSPAHAGHAGPEIVGPLADIVHPVHAAHPILPGAAAPAPPLAIKAPKQRPAKLADRRLSQPSEGAPGDPKFRGPAEAPGVPASPGPQTAGTREDPVRSPAAQGSETPGASGVSGPAMPDWDRLARNMGQLVEQGGKVASAFFKARDAVSPKPTVASDVTDMVKTLGEVATTWMSDPARVMNAQAAFSRQFVELWSESLRRLTGGEPKPVEDTPLRGDKRFAAPEWRASPVFDFLRQSYLMTTDWASSMVEEAEGLHPQTREKARFYLRQVSSALAPSNFLATNPELLRQTFEQSGDNLVRGMKMLAEDIEAGEGELRIRQSDRTSLELGVNMATTPGKVVLRNELMELIQYAPATPDVSRRPLLIVPPWINKFYVLDLNPEKSLIRWMVEHGLTVFVVSWVNPDERHADKGFEAYMREGILAAVDAIERATGEREVSTIGYCVGGTLLAVTLAYMAAKGDDRIGSATFFTAQTDFRDAGDLKVFAGEEQIAALEAEMAETGYLKGAKMANAFNMLRPNELIWSYVVDNYLKGKSPNTFDLLVWNSDSTRMPAANHAFYLRNCYLENKLTKGEMEIGGERLDLGKVTIPVYNLATREDHIAPARSVFTGSKYFGGPMRYVLAGSGHIAGVVNPPAKAKYQYWSGPSVEGTFEGWLAAAKETKGSWWPDWLAWVTALAPDRVAARTPGAGKLPALADAPGDYVRVQA